jgi:hypothetical protein
MMLAFESVAGFIGLRAVEDTVSFGCFNYEPLE